MSTKPTGGSSVGGRASPRGRPGRGKQTVPPAVIGVAAILLVGLLGLAGWLLLREGAAKPLPVTVRIDPVPEFVFLDGERLEYSREGDFEIAPGEHFLEVAVPGYVLLDTSLTVEPGVVNAFEFTLEVLPGVLTVSANTEAAISIDGEPVGTTPLAGLELEPGTYKLRADGGGDFQPLERELEIKGFRERQSVDLELIRNWSWVALASTPPGARVLDERDRLVGLAGEPIKVHAREAPYDWTLSGGPAFEPRVLSFTVEADADLDLGHFELDLDHAEVKLESTPPGLRIAVNGEMTGHATPHVFSVSPNREYAFALRSPHHRPAEKRLRPEPGREYSLVFEPEALLGKLKILTLPRGVEVYQGQKLLGLTPLELEYEAGEQSFVFRRLGYLEDDAKVTVRAGLETELNVTMKRAQ
ncbi:MAG: PEGA domain-containing protein [Verrucomicrobia bacterium]|jgi:hypothetical protein|nr:PEGA domain-containing protein [Verrucomicrobiota bacterium]